mgnify:CR=1 FL=1
MNMTEAVAVSRYILWPWLEPPTSTITTFWCISSTWQRTIAQIPHTTAVSGRASDTFKHHCYSILKPHSLYNLWICPSPPTPCQLDSREQLGAAWCADREHLVNVWRADREQLVTVWRSAACHCESGASGRCNLGVVGHAGILCPSCFAEKKES